MIKLKDQLAEAERDKKYYIRQIVLLEDEVKLAQIDKEIEYM